MVLVAVASPGFEQYPSRLAAMHCCVPIKAGMLPALWLEWGTDSKLGQTTLTGQQAAAGSTDQLASSSEILAAEAIYRQTLPDSNMKRNCPPGASAHGLSLYLSMKGDVSTKKISASCTEDT